MRLYTIEIKNDNGVGSVLYNAYLTEQDAFENFHLVMKNAEKSGIAIHGATIIDENLNIVHEPELAKRDSVAEVTKNFFTLEFQTNDDSGAIIPYAFTSKITAWDKYYDTLRYAVASSVKKHGCILITDDMFIVDKRLAERAPEPEPEPEVVQSGEGE